MKTNRKAKASFQGERDSSLRENKQKGVVPAFGHGEMGARTLPFKERGKVETSPFFPLSFILPLNLFFDFLFSTLQLQLPLLNSITRSAFNLSRSAAALLLSSYLSFFKSKPLAPLLLLQSSPMGLYSEPILPIGINAANCESNSIRNASCGFRFSLSLRRSIGLDPSSFTLTTTSSIFC